MFSKLTDPKFIVPVMLVALGTIYLSNKSAAVKKITGSN